MTSSFRPDRTAAARGFVPVSLAFAGASPAFAGASPAFEAAGPAPDSRERADVADEAKGAGSEALAGRPEASVESPPAEAPPPGPTPEEVEALEQAAYARGLAAAEAESGRIEAACAALEGAAAQWEALTASGVAAWQAGLLDLAATIARRWVDAELRIAPERLAAIVERAARSIEASDPFVCALHPEDHASVVAVWGERDRSDIPLEAMRFEADAGLAPGEFRLTTGATGIDGRFAAIAHELDARLQAALEEAPPESPGSEVGPSEGGDS